MVQLSVDGSIFPSGFANGQTPGDEEWKCDQGDEGEEGGWGVGGRTGHVDAFSGFRTGGEGDGGAGHALAEGADHAHLTPHQADPGERDLERVVPAHASAAVLREVEPPGVR